MATVRAYVPNPNFEDEIAMSEDTREALVELGGEVAGLADANVRALSGPWMPRPGSEVVKVEENDAGVWVVNTDYAAHLYEFGSARSPVHAPLRRAAMSAGLVLDEDPDL